MGIRTNDSKQVPPIPQHEFPRGAWELETTKPHSSRSHALRGNA